MMRFHWPIFDASQTLSAEETAELAARVAELTKAGLPLGEGLRALAHELPGRRLRRVLRTLADRLDAGMELGEAIDPEKGTGSFCAQHPEGRSGKRCLSPFPGLPPHLRGLVLAGLRSGRLAEVLEEYVDLQRSQAELRRRLVLSLIYPFILLAMLTAMAVLARFYAVEQFEKIFVDFNTRLPPLTVFFIRTSWPAMWGLVLLLTLTLTIPILLAAAPGMRWIWPLLHGLPMIGPLLRWSHLAQFGRLMGLLLEQHVPLPDAFRLCADGLRDPDLAYGCRHVANGVENGGVLYESMAARRQFPASLIPVVEWGQRAAALPDAFRAAAEMFEGRVRSQGSILEAILLPITFLLIVSYVGAFIVAMMLPLLSLIVRLSG